MRNLLLTVEYPPDRGGVARYLEALVSMFPTRFEVISDSSAILSKVVWPHWLKALRTLRRRRADYEQLWVSHIHPFGLVALFSKFLWRKPYVVILHGLDFRLALRNPWKRFLTRRILRGARLVVCNSKALSLDVRTFHYGIRPLVVYPTLTNIPEPPVSKMIRSDHVAHPLHLLTVARLVPRKNYSAIIESVSKLQDVEYTIVGDGPDRDKLRRQIQDLVLEDRVRILTNVSDVELGSAYAEADIFVLPVLPDKTDVEGFGIVYLEAAAAGLPIVATKMRGVDEALSPDGAIQLDDPTPEAIVEAINRLRDSAVRERMGKANREFVKRFSRESQFGKLEPYV